MHVVDKLCTKHVGNDTEFEKDRKFLKLFEKGKRIKKCYKKTAGFAGWITFPAACCCWLLQVYSGVVVLALVLLLLLLTGV